MTSLFMYVQPFGFDRFVHIQTYHSGIYTHDTQTQRQTSSSKVALSGAHTVGACHGNRSGFEGPWTDEKLKFDASLQQ